MTNLIPTFANEWARGTDQSEWNGKYDAIKFPIDFVLQRVTQASPAGIYKDARAEQLYEECAQVPVLGAWHFWSGFKDTQQQIDIYLDAIKGKRYGVHALDWEERNSKGVIINPFTKASAEEAGKWMRAVREATQKPVLIYIQRSDYAQMKSWGVSWLNDFDLWAKYWIYTQYLGTSKFAAICNAFGLPPERVHFLQYGGGAAGVQGYNQGLSYGTSSLTVDVDIYHNTPAHLINWTGVETPPLPPEPKPAPPENALEILWDEYLKTH